MVGAKNTEKGRSEGGAPLATEILQKMILTIKIIAF